MSMQDIGAAGWRAFWANLMGPATLALTIAMIVACVLIHIVFRRPGLVPRIVAAWILFVLVVSFAGRLGIDLSWASLQPLLELIQFPLYTQVA